MSVTLNIKTLAKKILICSEQQLIDRRASGNYSKSTRITKISKDIMDNLDIFGDCAQVVKEHVDSKEMYKVVKRLLQNPNAFETDVYQFPETRSSKTGYYFISKTLSSVHELVDSQINI